jgi:hypothetical protein
MPGSESAGQQRTWRHQQCVIPLLLGRVTSDECTILTSSHCSLSKTWRRCWPACFVVSAMAQWLLPGHQLAVHACSLLLHAALASTIAALGLASDSHVTAWAVWSLTH